MYQVILQRGKNQNSQHLLLTQYKHAIDSSTILSKADSNGKITYVNDAFCKIAQYTEEECLGRSHNIVRHPDMDASVFD